MNPAHPSGWAGSSLHPEDVGGHMPQRVSGFTEGVVKQSQGHVYVTFIKDHRGLDLDHIVKRAVRAQEDASIPHLVDNACRL